MNGNTKKQQREESADKKSMSQSDSIQLSTSKEKLINLQEYKIEPQP